MNPQPKVQERFSTLPKLWGNGLKGNKSWTKAKQEKMELTTLITY